MKYLKRCSAFFIAIILIISVMSMNIFSAETTNIGKGDVNGDGCVDIRDLVFAKKNMTDINFYSVKFDYNNDGSVYSNDLINLRRQLLGLSPLRDENDNLTVDGAGLGVYKDLAGDSDGDLIP